MNPYAQMCASISAAGDPRHVVAALVAGCMAMGMTCDPPQSDEQFQQRLDQIKELACLVTDAIFDEYDRLAAERN